MRCRSGVIVVLVCGIIWLTEGSIFGNTGERGPPNVGTGDGLSDETEYVGLDTFGSAILFGDFSGDYFMDIMFADENVENVQVGRWNHDAYTFEPAANPLSLGVEKVNGFAAADFNDDGLLDFLVSTEDGEGHIFYNSQNATGSFTHGAVLIPFHPGFLIVDAENDLVPDIFIADEDGKRGFFHNDPPGNFEYVEWEGFDPNCKIPKQNSNAFVDMDGDCHADLVITSSCGLEVWSNTARVAPRTLHMWTMSASDSELYRVFSDTGYDPSSGQIAYSDFTGDGTTDMISIDSRNKDLVLFSNVQEQKSFGTICTVDPTWSLEKSIVFIDVTIAESSLTRYFRIPPTLRVGDFNLDGLPDLMFVDAQTRDLRLLKNVRSDDKSAIQFEDFDKEGDLIFNDGDLVAAAAFDTDDSGRQDVVAVFSKGKSHLIWNSNRGDSDSLFFKGTGFSGISFFDDPKPFAPVPGNTFSISYDDENGQEFRTCSQCPQSAYLPLQRCNCFFGLRRVVNYIGEMSFGAGGITRSWQGLMPNSMALIWPDMSDGTKSWWMEYFIQRRGGQMIGVVIVLTTFLVIVGIVILFLSWKERVEDRQEKQQNTELFGFANN